MAFAARRGSRKETSRGYGYVPVSSSQGRGVYSVFPQSNILEQGDSGVLIYRSSSKSKASRNKRSEYDVVICMTVYKKNKKLPVSAIFERNLKRGMKHPDVKRLQQLLNSDPATRLTSLKGEPGSPGYETNIFGGRTEEAVQKFQVKFNIVSSGTPETTGYGLVGPQTRAKLKEVFAPDNKNKMHIKSDAQVEYVSELIKNALASAEKQLGMVAQPCETKACKYNQNNPGKDACATPTSPAEASEKVEGRHIDYHAVWLFYCMQFVRTCYGAPPAGNAIEVYNTFNRNDVIRKDHDMPLGAIVFWHWTTYGHVGIHLGGNQIIHTGLNSMEKGVRVDPLGQISQILGRNNYLGWANPPEFWIKTGS